MCQDDPQYEKYLNSIREEPQRATGNPALKLALGAVAWYRKHISPKMPAMCRFSPTCSTYGLAALKRFGFIKGSWLAFFRILRCNPFNPGGFDPVPETFTWKCWRRNTSITLEDLDHDLDGEKDNE